MRLFWYFNVSVSLTKTGLFFPLKLNAQYNYITILNKLKQAQKSESSEVQFCSLSSFCIYLLTKIKPTMLFQKEEMTTYIFTSRKFPRSILPSSVKNTCNGALSLKYHTGCWLFFTATCKSELGGPWDKFWNITIGRRVLADVPGCTCGTY